ncbi:SURF1 family-domain-containing protein [Dunaliella salina]|uniref:SURF1-like protein n=1 Tax=Dunaliella salina TaxID=3046 RepID=A0ABQ7GU86_DUNSA|nr:SURF1 family-domain-containing protein [Dunaliella salina]|eukprot:KAF5838164.1 SURF1 family-domain-containing protein [Dunaliella salina]
MRSAVRLLARTGSELWSTGAPRSPALANPKGPYYVRFQASSGAQQAASKAPFSPWSLVLYVPSAVTGFLAYWQWERSIWKEDLIKSREQMLQSPAQNVFELEDLKETQKVSASGRFVHGRSIFVGPRPRSLPGLGIQNGYFLITPLYDPVRQGAVLVNRGWVPKSWNENIEKVEAAWDAGTQLEIQEAGPQQVPSSSQAEPQKEKQGWFSWGRSKPGKEQPQAGPSAAKDKPTVQVVGMLQQSEQPSAVVPDNVPDNLEFHWVDVPTLARTVGLPADTPLLQRISDDPASQQQLHKGSPVQQAREATTSSPNSLVFPIPKNSADLVTFYTMPKDHLIYCGIWSSLCVVLGFMARHAIVKPPKTYRMVDQQAVWNSTRPS